MNARSLPYWRLIIDKVVEIPITIIIYLIVVVIISLACIIFILYFLIKYAIIVFLKILTALIVIFLRIIHEINEKNPYLFTTLILLICFIILLHHVSPLTIDFFTISNTNALTLMSIMIQSLVSILAIVVGFSFIAFQLSFRIGGYPIFKKFSHNIFLWSLFLIYGFSILYDLILARTLLDPNKNIENLGNYIDFSILLFLFSFMLLFPYTFSTIKNLKPERIMGHLSERDIFPSIIDAISTGNESDLKVGLRKLEGMVDHTLDSFFDFSSKISQCADFAFKKNSENCLIAIGESLAWGGICSIQLQMEVNSSGNRDKIIFKVDKTLNYFFNKAIERDWTRGTKSLLNERGYFIASLLSYSKNSSPRTMEHISEISKILDDFSNLSDINKDFSAEYFIETVFNILMDIYVKYEKFYVVEIERICINFEKYLDKTIDLIGTQGIHFAGESNKRKSIFISLCLKEIGYYCLSKKLDKPTDKIFEKLEEIEKKYRLESQRKDKGILENKWIIIAAIPIFIITIITGGLHLILKTIGASYLMKKTDRIFDFLDEMCEWLDKPIISRRQDIRKNILDVTGIIIETIGELIEEIRFKSIDHKFPKSSMKALNSLIQINRAHINEEDIKKQICNIIKKIENDDFFNLNIRQMNLLMKSELEFLRMHCRD